MVYFPVATPSNFSSSAWSTHYGGVRRIPDVNFGSIWMYLAWKVNFHGLDANVLWSWRHCCEFDAGWLDKEDNFVAMRPAFVKKAVWASGSSDNLAVRWKVGRIFVATQMQEQKRWEGGRNEKWRNVD